MESKADIFLSVVLIVRNQSERLSELLVAIGEVVSRAVSDYELIVVDNGSTDDTMTIARQLTSEEGLPNLQVYCLLKEVDDDTAAWVGLENSLGDFAVVVDPNSDDTTFLPRMLKELGDGVEVVFANSDKRLDQDMLNRIAFSAFNTIFRLFNSIDLVNEAPKYRLLSRRVINFVSHYPQPPLAYRHLPATGGFGRSYLSYSGPKRRRVRTFGESFDRAMRLLVSTTRAPMRLVARLCLFGACANLLYSVYVIVVGFARTDVAPGWVTLSLQQSGMFFLISLVLLVLSEYILQMASLSNEGPPCYIAQEFTSARMTRREKLNIEERTGAAGPKYGKHAA